MLIRLFEGFRSWYLGIIFWWYHDIYNTKVLIPNYHRYNDIISLLYLSINNTKISGNIDIFTTLFFKDYNNPVRPKKIIPRFIIFFIIPNIFNSKNSTKTNLTKRNILFKKIIIFTILGLFLLHYTTLTISQPYYI